MTILNLGCGTKTHPDCVNIDWSIHLHIAGNPVLRKAAKAFLNRERVSHIASLASSIVVHDLRKGIPYPDGSVDAVYHSHVLEHLSRNLDDPRHDCALNFIKECRRVLRPGGILRVVVPEFAHHARAYLDHYQACEADESKATEHDRLIFSMLGQAVRTEAFGTSKQRPLARWLENILLGDARKRGETHMWEYDKFSLKTLLNKAGFEDVRQESYMTSRIDGWQRIALDLNAAGGEYRPTSLYMEAMR